MLADSNGAYAKIKVIGIGGAGMNAVDRMIDAGLEGVEFLAMNTNLQGLELCKCVNKLHIGPTLTRGLGAGGNPELGKQSAEESMPEIKRLLDGADMVFVAAGMGGGTGTGAAPIVAQLTRELDILTVAVVTKPLIWEGATRARAAEKVIAELREVVDTLIVVPNDRLIDVVEKKTTFQEAFRIADEVLRQGVQGISDIITVPGMIDVDFNDVRSIMANQGTALMGIGFGTGEDKAVRAAEMACKSPLVETTIDGAKGILMNVTAGPDITLAEIHEAAEMVSKACDTDDANLIFGAVIDPSMKDEVRITIVATGFDSRERTKVAVAASGAKSEQSSRGVFEVPDSPTSGTDELEIPTFLRNTSR